MTFTEYAKSMITTLLQSRQSLRSIVDAIKAKEGQIAFFPCTRITREMLAYIIAREPQLLPRITGCFDSSDEVNIQEGIRTYNVKMLDNFTDQIALLVVGSNYFHSREMEQLRQSSKYAGPILNTSRMETTIPEDMDVISAINQVHDLLADEKSKMTYLITWLSRLLNDEALTYLFENDEEAQGAEYASYTFHGLTDVCQKEAFSDLYQIKHVLIEKGESVLDIGAYKGDTAILFAHRVGAKGSVFSFEPIKANYECLLENIRANRIEDIVIPVNKACSDRSGILNLVSISSGAPWSYVSDDERNEVEAISIDGFVKQREIEKVDYIKIDAEGWEEKVLQGALGTIQEFKPKLAICLYHDSSHLLSIPLLVHSIAGYQMYFRCKIEGPFGGILYCKGV